MQAGKRLRLAKAALPMAIVAVSGLLTGCGQQYRPVVSAINPVGPAPQPTKYAIAVSNTSQYGSAPAPGLLTFVDFSGDTILSTPSILPFPAPTTPGTATTAAAPVFVNPLDFSLTQNGGEGFIVNNTGNFETFPTGNPTSLLTQNILPQTLAPGALPNGVESFNLPSTGQTLFVPESNLSTIAELSVGAGASLLQNLSVANPVYTVGADSAQRVYAIDQGNGVANGRVYPIENTPVSLLTPITVGADPVYGVMTTDGNRAFILNKGSGTLTVINVPSNALDAGVSATVGGVVTPGTIALPANANPVWADIFQINSELVVLNQGDGVNPGSLSIINIPLCSIASPVTNPNCDASNPIDASGFGAIVKTVNVGVNPTMVSILNDGVVPRAYVVNSGILPGVNATYPNGIEGSVSVVNMNSGVVTATIPAISNPSATSAALGAGSTPTEVYGHPNTISATTGTPTGKVYVTSSDNKFLTVIETDTDTVDTHIFLQGLGVRVLVTSK